MSTGHTGDPVQNVSFFLCWLLDFLSVCVKWGSQKDFPPWDYSQNHKRSFEEWGGADRRNTLFNLTWLSFPDDKKKIVKLFTKQTQVHDEPCCWVACHNTDKNINILKTISNTKVNHRLKGGISASLIYCRHAISKIVAIPAIMLKVQLY